MTTPATITTEELDALAAKHEAAATDTTSRVVLEQMSEMRRSFVLALCTAAPRLIEQAREANDLRAAPMLSADADLMIKLGAAEQALNIHKAAFATAEAGRISYRDLFAAAESALSATRERLEIAESLLEDARDTICVVQTDHAKYSIGEIDKYFAAIAAKACTGGKGGADMKAFVASEYMDDGRYGVLSDCNDIIIRISDGFSKFECLLLAGIFSADASLAHEVAALPKGIDRVHKIKAMILAVSP